MLDTEIDLTLLSNKIKDALIQSQYDAWIELDEERPTADWINGKIQRARDFYLGSGKDRIFEKAKFNRLIQVQVSFIMQEIQKSLNTGEQTNGL